MKVKEIGISCDMGSGRSNLISNRAHEYTDAQVIFLIFYIFNALLSFHMDMASKKVVAGLSDVK